MIKITLRNYRGFNSQSPAIFTLDQGFTAFIGKNNAGKSTCLKAIFELRELFKLNHIWHESPNQASFNCATEPDLTAIFNSDNEDPIYVSIEILPNEKISRPHLIKSTLKIIRTGQVSLESFKIYLNQSETIEIKSPFSFIRHVQIVPEETDVEISFNYNQYVYSCSNFLSALNNLTNSVYYGAYRNAINEGAKFYYDIAVGTALIDQWDFWKAGLLVANQKAISRVETDVERLLGYKSVQINASSDNKTLIVNIDKQPFKLSDLGAGVAELIITLSNALIKRPAYILIDEPESHLHPSLQIDFLTTLASYSQHGIAFSTHSIGLARSIGDRIYAVSKSNGVSVCNEYHHQQHLSELLGNLSYSGYFPLEHAYVLLVEGSTEVRTVQILLSKLKKDHLFVILPLGGSSLIKQDSDIELAEVIRIAGGCVNVFAIIDSERSSESAQLDASRVAFIETCNKLKIKLHVTERRATENYFSEEAIKKALGDSFSKLESFESLKRCKNPWSKASNWKIAIQETEEFFSSNDLGRFLLDLPCN